jgi:hypothetical protein
MTPKCSGRSSLGDTGSLRLPSLRLGPRSSRREVLSRARERLVSPATARADRGRNWSPEREPASGSRSGRLERSAPEYWWPRAVAIPDSVRGLQARLHDPNPPLAGPGCSISTRT